MTFDCYFYFEITDHFTLGHEIGRSDTTFGKAVEITSRKHADTRSRYFAGMCIGGNLNCPSYQAMLEVNLRLD